MFKPLLVYILIKRNHVTVVNLRVGREAAATAQQSFSTDRVVLGSFNSALVAVLEAMRMAGIKRSWLKSIKVAIQQTEGTEGGLSDIEKRALRDLAEMAGGNKVYIIEEEQRLSNEQAVALILGKDTGFKLTGR